LAWRPRFLDRWLARLPDVFSLRTQVVLGTGLSAGVLALLFVLASSHLDATRSGEALQEHAETLAKTASIWLDGDAHVGLGNDPAKRLSDLTSSLDTLLRTSDYPGSMRTLRPKAVQKATLTAQPAVVHPEAMEVVIRTGTDHGKPEADYRPEMGKALFEGKSATVIANGRVEAYAPVLDS